MELQLPLRAPRGGGANRRRAAGWVASGRLARHEAPRARRRSVTAGNQARNPCYGMNAAAHQVRATPGRFRFRGARATQRAVRVPCHALPARATEFEVGAPCASAPCHPHTRRRRHPPSPTPRRGSLAAPPRHATAAPAPASLSLWQRAWSPARRVPRAYGTAGQPHFFAPAPRQVVTTSLLSPLLSSPSPLPSLSYLSIAPPPALTSRAILAPRACPLRVCVSCAWRGCVAARVGSGSHSPRERRRMTFSLSPLSLLCSPLFLP